MVACKATYGRLVSASHLHLIMKPQEYIQSKLDDLKMPLGITKPADNDELMEAIFRTLMSKKFRKNSANETLQKHIREAIKIRVNKNEPINITFVHGAYKLRRLDEAPEADWAELFALMHYTKWLRPICELYEPGVWLDLFVDDLIVPHLGTASTEDVTAYLNSYQEIIDFLSTYFTNNFKISITTVGSRFASEEAFEKSLQESINLKQTELPDGLPILTDAEKTRVELHTNTTKEQLQDPNWRERVVLIETAYSRTKAEPGYHKVPDKILAFTSSIPGVAIAVGSTKDSIAKFWVGAEALKPLAESYRQLVLTPKQLENLQYQWQHIDLGIKDKNFKRIRVLTA